MDLIDKILKLAAETTLPIEYVTEDVAAWRMSVCLGCEHRDASKEKCKVCGCYLEVKVGCKTNRNPEKLRSEITHCPMGKWNDKDTANAYRSLDKIETLN
jgi:hypothetical protein